MLDLIAIAQSAPGAIAVNGAIVVGYKLAGISGALVAIIATILPPFLILTVLSFLYERFRSNLLLSQLLAGMQAGVGAVIASVVWDMGTDAVRQKKYRVDRNHAWCVSGCLLFPCERRLHYSLLYCARYCPDAACTQEEPEMITLQLFSEFSADRPVQLRRRLRGDAASSGAACCPERLAERTGICRSCDHCGNDARSDRGERGDLRRHEACWAPRCAASGKCFLGWGAGDACRDKLDDAAAFCRLLAAAAQNKAEPNSDNGTRGSHQCRESCFGRIAGSGKSD